MKASRQPSKQGSEHESGLLRVGLLLNQKGHLILALCRRIRIRTRSLYLRIPLDIQSIIKYYQLLNYYTLAETSVFPLNSRDLQLSELQREVTDHCPTKLQDLGIQPLLQKTRQPHVTGPASSSFSLAWPKIQALQLILPPHRSQALSARAWNNRTWRGLRVWLQKPFLEAID